MTYLRRLEGYTPPERDTVHWLTARIEEAIDPTATPADISGQITVQLVALSPYAPTVADIAAILRARAVELGGFRVETFTDRTVPSAQQVQQLIGLYTPMVFARLGRLDSLHCANAGDLRSAARALAGQRVALEVEASYWPEEIVDAAAVDVRRTLLADDLAALVPALEACRASGDEGGDGGDSTSRSDPAWRYPLPRLLRF
jgi:hypothetical protein